VRGVAGVYATLDYLPGNDSAIGRGYRSSAENATLGIESVDRAAFDGGEVSGVLAEEGTGVHSPLSFPGPQGDG
jgi:hypothetical protein